MFSVQSPYPLRVHCGLYQEFISHHMSQELVLLNRSVNISYSEILHTFTILNGNNNSFEEVDVEA